MDKRIGMKIKNLELLLRIKSLILKVSSKDQLLSQVCNEIVGLEVYDVAWAVLTNDDNSAYATYSSNENLGAKVEYLCWKDSLNSPELYLHSRNSTICKSCILSANQDSTMVSKRLEKEGLVYGVFSVSLNNCLLDEDVKGQISDLADDISTALHAIQLKAKNKKFQEELSETKNMYKKLLETSSLPIGIMGLDYKISFMSKSLKEMFGYSSSDTSVVDRQKKGLDFLLPGFDKNAKEFMADVLKNDAVRSSDVVFNTVDGRQLHMRLNVSLMRNKADKATGFMIVFHDLSSEIKTAEELQLSEKKFRLLFLKAPHGVSLLSPSGIILDCNEEEAAMLLMTREEMIGEHVKSFLSLKHQLEFKDQFQEFKTKGAKNIVVKLVRKDGIEIYVERSVSALNDAEGQLQSIVVHSHDVTKDIKSREQIKLLYSAIEQSTSVFTITDLDGNITYVNNRFTELTGYSFSEVQGRNPNVLKSGLMSDVVYREMWKSIITGKSWSGELCNKRKNGELYWEHASMTAIFNSDGELTNFLKVAEDITRRRKSDQEIKEATVRYHNIFDLVPNPIVIHIDGYIVDANQAAFLFSKGENMKSLMGMEIMRFVHDSSRDLISSRVKFLRDGGETIPVVDAIYVNLKGESRNVRTVSKEVSFKGKRAFMIVFEDITDRKVGEKKLLESEKKFKNIFNLHPDPVSIADIHTGVLYEANDAFLNAINMKREDVIGVSSYDFDIYEDITLRKKLADTVLKEGKVLNQEVTFKLSSGQLTALVSGAIVDEEERSKVLFVARDITKMKKAEAELQEMNVRYRNIFNMAPNPIIIHIKGIIVEVNRAALLFANAKKRSDLVGTDIMKYVHDSSKKEILRQILELNRGGKIPPFDAVFLNLKGEKRDVRTASNIISFGGEQAYMVFFEDITESKRAVQKLIESEKRFRMFFNLIPIPVIITNMSSGTFLEFNEAALKLTGGTYNDYINKNVIEYGLFPNLEIRDRLLNKLYEEGTLLNEELVLRINNKVLTMLVSASTIAPIEEQNVLWVAHDITERKEMEQDLIKARNKAEANEKLKSSFLSNISHEIRTPMNAILGFSDLLRDSSIEDEYRNQYINIIQQRGKDLLKMISDIMDISKIESGSLIINNRAVRIKNVIREVLEKAEQTLADMNGKSLEVKGLCDIDNAQLVNGDKYRITQVLNNLMENAIKFTQKGGITLSCGVESDKVVFSIEDTGCGIAAEKLDLAFDRFVQVYDIKDVTIGGSGLGLSISKSLLQLMGGDIWIESELDKGTTVHFTLNAYDGSGPMSGVKKPILEKMRDWSNKTILVAEDEPSNQMFIKVILGKTKVKILMANDGKEAVALYNTHKEKIDLILVDVKMPELNGYEVTELIKKDNPSIPVIALTANAMNNDREEALSRGCDDYLTKPIAKEVLYTAIEKYING